LNFYKLVALRYTRTSVYNNWR